MYFLNFFEMRMPFFFGHYFGQVLSRKFLLLPLHTHLAVCQRACFTNASLILHYSLWNHTSITLPSICPELNPASIEAQKRVFSHFVLLLSFSSFHSSFPVLWGYHHEVYSLTCLVFGVVDCWRVGAIEMRIPPQVFLSIHCK